MTFLINFLLNRKLKEIKQKEFQNKFDIIFSVLSNKPNTLDEIISDRKEQRRKENK